MFLQDVINKNIVCFLIPPKTHLLATPCNPVYALNIKQQTLYIRGKPKAKCLFFVKPHQSIDEGMTSDLLEENDIQVKLILKWIS